jgi:capsular exopolysaccharide synthesis family protein
MLAEAGFRTVLVDTDLRKSVLKERHNFTSNEEMRGLDYYLSGQAEYADIIYQTNIANGDFIPCTNLLENPATLFEDPRFKELFDRLSNEYRYVIVDAPPLANVADGALIASLCDGAILVVNSGETPKTLVRQSINQLERANCKLLGIVLNKAAVVNHSYYKYYGKYYSNYYYGNDQDENQ